jgi:predicted metalloendopeptidase
MKRHLTLLLIVVATGCTQPEDAGNSQASQAEVAPDHEMISGIDQLGMNNTVRPQDDFYEYANGSWLANTEIPAEEVGWGSYMTLHKRSQEQSKAIIVELAELIEEKTPEQQQIGDFYNAWMNQDRVNALGIKPLGADLAEIDAIDSHDEVAAFFGKLNPDGMSGPFNFYVSIDRKDSTRYIVYYLQSGLGLPDRDYYFDESERGQALVSGYKTYIGTLLSLAGLEDTEEAASRVFELEKRLAGPQWDKVKNRDRDLTYNTYSESEFTDLLAAFNLDAYLAGIGVAPQETVIVMQPSYFEALNGLFREIDVDTWKDYLRMRLLTSFANYLSDDFVNARFEMYSRLLYGREEMQPRWRRAVSSINNSLGELLGKIYVERHFSPESKEKMVEMVDNLIAAYRDSIQELDWMGEETKAQALDKLSKFNPKIGYPDKWKDYSDLAVDAGDLVGNIRRARSWSHFENVGKLGKPIDKDEWFMAPQEVNAYYYASRNEIVFPAAFLQPPNFIPDAEDAFNYGAIGSTIGHEIGHGFDDQGSKFDGEGNLKSWWTDEDRSRFEEKTKGLVAQFDRFEVLPGLFIKGDLTLGENIGDLGGTAIALRAYRRSLSGREGPVIDGFSADERFFIGNAQSSRLKWREEYLEMMVKNDPHAPDKYRVNGVFSNMNDFYRVYEVKEGDELFLPPEERISIWQ